MRYYLRPAETGVLLVLGAIWLVGLVGGFLLYNDLRQPISNVTGYTNTPAIPGTPIKLYFVYTRTHTPNLTVVSRRLVCENGSVWTPQTLDVAQHTSDAWPNGEGVEASITIMIPAEIEAPDLCYYSSTVAYHRVLLPDQLLQMPPVPIKIEVIAPLRGGLDALRS